MKQNFILELDSPYSINHFKKLDEYDIKVIYSSNNICPEIIIVEAVDEKLFNDLEFVLKYELERKFHLI